MTLGVSCGREHRTLVRTHISIGSLCAERRGWSTSGDLIDNHQVRRSLLKAGHQVWTSFGAVLVRVRLAGNMERG